MTKRMKTLHIMLVGLFAMFLTSCDEHRDFPDISTKPGHILLTTGKVVSAEDYKSKGGTPIAVVYYIKQSSSDAGLGYAVYLHDVYDVLWLNIPLPPANPSRIWVCPWELPLVVSSVDEKPFSPHVTLSCRRWTKWWSSLCPRY